MPLDRLVVCEWRGVERQDRVADSPMWRLVQQAIQSLDGQRLNDLYLFPQIRDASTFLAISGGAGRYLVRGSGAGGRLRTAIDPERLSCTTLGLLVGGQSGDYPSHWIVGFDTAVVAARVYWSCGGYASTIRWEEG